MPRRIACMGLLSPRRPSLRAVALAMVLAGTSACNESAIPPEANIVAPATARIGEVVQIDGTGSSDAGDRTLNHLWRLTARPNSSNAELNDSASPNPTFAPDRPGTYELELVVFNGSLPSDPATATIVVPQCGNRPPEVVSLRTQPATPAIGDTVRLEARIADPDSEAGCGQDQTVAFTWRLRAMPTGSGAFLNDPTEASPWFEADLSGAYQIELVAVDSSGLASPPAMLTVEAAGGGAPPPGFTTPVSEVGQALRVQAFATPEATIAAAPVEVAFSSEVSGGHPPYSWAWDFGGAGTSTSSAPTLALRPGNHEMALRVTDGIGDTAAATVEVMIEPDTIPVASVTLSDADDLDLAPLHVDLDCATHGGNGPLAYEWQFGDGQRSSRSAVSHIYVEAGSYTATCTVTDTDGDAVTASATITAASDSAPVPAILGGPLDGRPPLVVDLSSSVAGGNGNLEYDWDFGARRIASSDLPDPAAVSYARPGTYTVALQVTDADGDVGEAYTAVVVGPTEHRAVGEPGTLIARLSARGQRTGRP